MGLVECTGHIEGPGGNRECRVTCSLPESEVVDEFMMVGEGVDDGQLGLEEGHVIVD